MAVPKKKTSTRRQALRRSGQTHKLSVISTISCPNCGAPVPSLYVCPSCGTYKKREVITFKEEESDESIEAQESVE